jgi:hypothetical protein
MTHPLDELREQLWDVYAETEVFLNDRAELDPFGAAYVEWSGIVRALDAFIEAHPGMTDSTMPCRKCRRPIADGQYLGGFPYSEYAPYCDKCWDGGERERFMKLHQLMSGTSRRPAP